MVYDTTTGQRDLHSQSHRLPLPWVPRGRIENLRGSRRLAAPPLSHWVPAALAAAPRQGFLGSFGPRAVKSVTTHFRGVSLGLHLPSHGL